MAWFGLNVTLPALVTIGTWLAYSLTGPVLSAAFWESAAVAFYLLVAYSLPVLLARRERRLRRAGVLT